MLRVTKLEFERAVRPALARAMRRQTSPSNTSAHQALSAYSQEKVEAKVTAPLTNDKAFSTILSLISLQLTYPLLTATITLFIHTIATS
jgi:hypothetical protein